MKLAILQDMTQHYLKHWLHRYYKDKNKDSFLLIDFYVFDFIHKIYTKMVINTYSKIFLNTARDFKKKLYLSVYKEDLKDSSLRMLFLMSLRDGAPYIKQ